MFPEITQFFSFHLVVEKDPDDIFECKTFELSQDRIEHEKTMLEKHCEEIKNEKKFNSTNVSFASAITIGSMSEDAF